MKEIDKIVRLLGADALERKVAAAIVLGELEAKGPEVTQGLGKLLASNVPVLQRHALDALARIGAKRSLPAILPLLTSQAAEVREAATRAVASVGEDALPLLKERMTAASHDERRALDGVLAEIGGKDAFGELLRGLASSDAEAAKAAALAVRQQVKGADARQKKTYATATLKLLADLGKKKDAQPVAVAGAIKILGFLEDERSVPVLIEIARDPAAAPIVRMEAVLALRFSLKEATAEVVDALVLAADAADRTLSQAALVTLGSLPLDKGAVKRMTPLVLSPDPERAAFAVQHLAGQKGPEVTALLAKALTSKDKRVAEGAAQALGTRDDAGPTLARALLETDGADRAWAIRGVLRPLAAKLPPALKRELVDSALARVKEQDRGFEGHLDVAREADPVAVADGLRDLATKVKKKSPDKAQAILGLLARSEKGTPADKFAVAVMELKKSPKDTSPAARSSDEALQQLGRLIATGFDVVDGLKRDKTLEPEDLYYVGFHFSEQRRPAGEDLLALVVERGGRTKIAKMAKNKLKLTEG